MSIIVKIRNHKKYSKCNHQVLIVIANYIPSHQVIILGKKKIKKANKGSTAQITFLRENNNKTLNNLKIMEKVFRY